MWGKIVRFVVDPQMVEVFHPKRPGQELLVKRNRFERWCLPNDFALFDEAYADSTEWVQPLLQEADIHAFLDDVANNRNNIEATPEPVDADEHMRQQMKQGEPKIVGDSKDDDEPDWERIEVALLNMQKEIRALRGKYDVE